MKKIILALLLILIAGCGLSSKDTVSETKPVDNTTIYAMTDKGISISSNNGGKWDRSIQKSRLNNIISSVFTDIELYNNALIIATDRGLTVPSKNMDKYDNYLEDQKINDLLSEASTLYVAADTGCYITTRNYQMIQISKTTDLVKVFSAGNLLYTADTNQVQVCTKNIYEWKTIAKFSGENILDIFMDKDSFVLTNKGFYVNGKKIETIADETFYSLFYDKIKKIFWVAGNKGLHKSGDRGTTWVDFDKANGLEIMEVQNIFADNLNIYLATPYGLVHSINGGETWKVYKKQNGLLSNNIFRVIAEKN